MATTKKGMHKMPDGSMMKNSMMKKGGSVGKTATTPAQKKFAALAPPKDKITFADKIAGSKKKK